MLTISVTVHDPDPDRADLETRRLRNELLELDISDVRFPPGPPVPPAAKSVTSDVVTTIVVSVATSPVLQRLGVALQEWVKRDRHRRIVVKEGDRSIEIHGSPSETERKLINDFFTKE